MLLEIKLNIVLERVDPVFYSDLNTGGEDAGNDISGSAQRRPEPAPSNNTHPFAALLRTLLVPAESTGDLGDPQARLLLRVVFGQVLGRSASPHLMAAATNQDDRPRIEQAVPVRKVMDLGTLPRTNMALAVEVVPDHVTKQFPLVGLQKVVVVHVVIYSTNSRFPKN
ncbi:MAG: hypothetical protein U0791_23875 [Gemmataceae bacterium]